MVNLWLIRATQVALISCLLLGPAAKSLWSMALIGAAGVLSWLHFKLNAAWMRQHVTYPGTNWQMQQSFNRTRLPVRAPQIIIVAGTVFAVGLIHLLDLYSLTIAVMLVVAGAIPQIAQGLRNKEQMAIETAEAAMLADYQARYAPRPEHLPAS